MEGLAVIIAAKDAEATIGRAVASALTQPEAAEVIVVDDASTDGTAAAAAAANDGTGRLLIHSFSANRGPAAARNYAIAQSSSPLVCSLDADDFWLGGRLARLLQLGEGYPWDLLADNLERRAEEDTGRGLRLLIEPELARPEQIGPAQFVTGNISVAGRPRRELGFLKPIMRRAFLERHRLTFDERLRLGEDYILYLKALLAEGLFILTPACGYIAVERRSSLSVNHSADDLAHLLQAEQEIMSRSLEEPVLQALRLHRRALRLNLGHRQILNLKQERRWPEIFSRMVRSPRLAMTVLQAASSTRRRPRGG